MIIVMRQDASDADLKHVLERIEELGLQTHLSQGEERTIVGVIGDDRPVNHEMFEPMGGVDRVIQVLHPFKLASRDFHPQDTVISLNGTRIGDRNIAVMAGPCAVEDRAQMTEVTHALCEAGVKILRGGAF
jgi:3-deoxy-7-phosphoheptulonate synthase